MSINFSQTERFQIVNNSLLKLANIGQQNMGDSNTLCNFLTWGINHFPAKKYAIILGGHGNGINGFGRDMTFNNDTLTLDEIENSFATAKEITLQNFEIIGFDSCLMSSLEVANSISSYASFMVSSQEVEPEWGWNYTSIFKYLILNPEQNGYMLGRVISDSYYNSSEKLSEVNDFEVHKMVTLSIVNLTKIPQLAYDLNLYISHLIEDVKDFQKILTVINTTEKIERYGKSFDSSSGLIDIGNLISNLNRIFPEFIDLANPIQKQLNESIVYKIRGDQKINSNGLSIYMPKIAEDVSKHYVNTLPSWQKIIILLKKSMLLDKDSPTIQSYVHENIITGNIYNKDIQKIILDIHDSNSNEFYFEEVEPSLFLNQ